MTNTNYQHCIKKSHSNLKNEEFLNIGVHFQKSMLNEPSEMIRQKSKKWDIIVPSRSSKFVDSFLNTTNLELAMNRCISKSRATFNELLITGPPVKSRWETWKAAINYRTHRITGVYNSMCNKTRSSYLQQIAKDVARTFTTHPFFNSKQFGSIGCKMLQNILIAFSNYCKEVRYCQGINYLAGFLLLVSGGREEETFWFLVIIISKTFGGNKCALSGFYNGNFELLKECINDFMSEFSCKFPVLYSQFKDKFIPDALWIQKWYMTFFLYGFNLGLSLRIWDYILVEGVKGFTNISLSIIQRLETQLPNKTDVEIRNVFSSLNSNASLSNLEQIIMEARYIKAMGSCASFPLDDTDEKYIHQ